jgi:Right handed beta helix region/Chondroitinase B
MNGIGKSRVGGRRLEDVGPRFDERDRRLLSRHAITAVLCAAAFAILGGSSAFGTADPLQRPITCPAGGQMVHDAAELRTALETAKPGDVIRMADGIYTGAFTVTSSGTQQQPIFLCGSRNAVLDGEARVTYVLHLNGADWWRLVGFTVREGLKGVVADRADHDTLSGLLVTGTGSEAIRLRTFSSDNRVVGNTVRDTGSRQPRYGEGIYVGSAHDDWCRFTGCEPDRSDRNAVVGNVIADTTAEGIDVKEGTTGGVIAGNRLSGAGMTDADSWIELKGNGWRVEHNTGRDSPEDGIQTYVVSRGWGRRNVFRANRLVVNGPGYGIYIDQDESSKNVVRCDNVAVGAHHGLSNIPCRRR